MRVSMAFQGYVSTFFTALLLRLQELTPSHIKNEDCGQMSAWYLFSALGFYPVNPVSGEYVVGRHVHVFLPSMLALSDRCGQQPVLR